MWGWGGLLGPGVGQYSHSLDDGAEERDKGRLPVRSVILGAYHCVPVSKGMMEAGSLDQTSLD